MGWHLLAKSILPHLCGKSQFFHCWFLLGFSGGWILGGLCPFFLFFIYNQETFVACVAVSLVSQSFSLTLIFMFINIFTISIVSLLKMSFLLCCRKQESLKTISVKVCMNKIQTTLEEDSESYWVFSAVSLFIFFFLFFCFSSHTFFKAVSNINSIKAW